MRHSQKIFFQSLLQASLSLLVCASWASSESEFSVKLTPVRHHGKQDQGAEKTRSQAEALLPAASTKYTIQLEAMTSKELALKKVEVLKEKRLSDLWIMSAVVSGESWFRICTGHFESAITAASARREIIKQTAFKDAFVQKARAELNASDQ